MKDVTPEQFAESVRAAIGTVTHFYGQIDRLNAALREELTSDPDRFSVLGGIPPQPGRRQDSRVIRCDYGTLYHVDAAEGDDDVEEEELDDDLETGEESERPRRQSRVIELLPDQLVLAVRTLLFQPRRPEELEPQIIYTVLTDWRCSSQESASKARGAFRIKRYMAARVLRAINPLADTPVGGRITTKATVMGGSRASQRSPDRALSMRLAALIRPVRLYDLDGSGAVEKLAADIKAYWHEYVNKGVPDADAGPADRPS